GGGGGGCGCLWLGGGGGSSGLDTVAQPDSKAAATSMADAPLRVTMALMPLPVRGWARSNMVATPLEASGCHGVSKRCRTRTVSPARTSMVWRSSGESPLRSTISWGPAGRKSWRKGGVTPTLRPSTHTSPHGLMASCKVPDGGTVAAARAASVCSARDGLVVDADGDADVDVANASAAPAPSGASGGIACGASTDGGTCCGPAAAFSSALACHPPLGPASGCSLEGKVSCAAPVPDAARQANQPAPT